MVDSCILCGKPLTDPRYNDTLHCECVDLYIERERTRSKQRANAIPRVAIETLVAELEAHRDNFRAMYRSDGTLLDYEHTSAAQLDYVIYKLRALLDAHTQEANE